MPEKMRQPQVWNLTKGYEFRYIYNMPERYKKVICLCEYTVYSWKNPKPGFCECGKIAAWNLYKCIKCDTIFIRDFSWPWWCGIDAQCWDCIQTMDKACPKEGHEPIPLYRENGYPLRTPSGRNPRKFTEEELADFKFDFE